MITQLLHAIFAKPFVYNTWQFIVVGPSFRRRLQAFIGDAIGGILLDIGCGTGLNLGLVQSRLYVGVDTDPLKLTGLTDRPLERVSFLLGDGAALSFKDKAADSAMCVFVAHHLDDDQLHEMLAEVARTVSGKFFLVDALRHPDPVSRFFWHFDRGRYPRTQVELESALRGSFDIEKIETFRHRHLLRFGLFLCTPKPAK